MKAQLVVENLEFTRGQDSKKSLDVGLLRGIEKPKNLFLPLKYEYGMIVDRHGDVVIKANREAGTTPLNPSERDDLLKITTQVLNWALGSPEEIKESMEFTRGNSSKKALDIGIFKNLPTELSIKFPIEVDEYPYRDIVYLLDKNGEVVLDQNFNGSGISYPEGKELFKAIAELLNFYYSKEGSLKESLDFVRGQDSKKSLNVGAYRPGSYKEFEDAGIGNPVLDYNGEKGSMAAKVEAPYRPYKDGDPWKGIDGDPLHDFIKKYDTTGAGAEMFMHPEYSPVDPGENLQLIAFSPLPGSGSIGPYVYPYGEEGAYAVWGSIEDFINL